MKPWQKMGPPQVIAKKYGISLLLQKFFRTEQKKEIDWALISGDSKTVVIFPVTKNLEVVAIKEFKCGSNKIMLQLPCGNSLENENLLVAGRRELLEETGYQAGSTDFLAQSELLYFEPTHVAGGYTAVLARDCTRTGQPRLDETEDIETEIIPLKQWMEMIWKGEITDSKSIAVTLLALGSLEAP